MAESVEIGIRNTKIGRTLSLRSAIFGVLIIVLLAQVLLYSQRKKREEVGKIEQGGFLLNSGWRLRPAGKNIPLSTLPMSHAMSPQGRMLAVMNGGYVPPSVSMLDLETGKEVGRTQLGDGWRGLAFSPSGDKLYAGNGARPWITEFSVSGGALTPGRRIDLFPGEKAGVAHLIADLAFQRNRLLVADNARDAIIAVDLASGKVEATISTARNPYAMLLHPDGKSIFISSWSTSRVIQYRISDGVEMSSIQVGAHPTEMVWLPTLRSGENRSPRLAVACANTNQVYVLGMDETKWRVMETLNLAMSPRQPVGMTPSALSLSPDGRTLYVACSDANAIAVADVSGERSKVLGFVPTGWYPTSVRALRDGRLLVLNGKGLGSYPNPKGTNPNLWPQPGLKLDVQYVAGIQIGSASIIDNFDENQLRQYTKTVIENSPYRDSLLDYAGVPAGNPVPNRIGGASPIEHVIFLMKENRTYDQVLGDMKEGNGDPSLVLFGEKITPNHHKIAREFVLLDNFYVNADVSADGFYWTTAAIAPDSNQRTWPMGYARRSYGRGEPSPEGTRSAPGGHLWDKAAEASVSFYNYGFTAVNLPHPPDVGTQIQDVRDPVLKPHTNYNFRQHDRSFSDIDRIQVFIHDLAGWEKTGKMPRLVVMTIGNDHTQGTTSGIRSPISCVADNDQALGIMVEALTKSAFWRNTAMFVLEDDAQDGADHVDSHRSLGYVISPYTKRKTVDSTLYNTTSMLRTVELILGLKPMTVFDAGARPMASVFQAKPDLRAYTNEPPQVPLNDKNPGKSATAQRSQQLDFSESDLADDRELNEILWLAIKGTPPPAPARSVFSR